MEALGKKDEDAKCLGKSSCGIEKRNVKVEE